MFIEMEKDKMNAILYREFGMDNAELEAAIDKFGLLEMDEMKTFAKIINSAR